MVSTWASFNSKCASIRLMFSLIRQILIRNGVYCMKKAIVASEQRTINSEMDVFVEMIRKMSQKDIWEMKLYFESQYINNIIMRTCRISNISVIIIQLNKGRLCLVASDKVV